MLSITCFSIVHHKYTRKREANCIDKMIVRAHANRLKGRAGCCDCRASRSVLCASGVPQAGATYAQTHTQLTRTHHLRNRGTHTYTNPEKAALSILVPSAPSPPEDPEEASPLQPQGTPHIHITSKLSILFSLLASSDCCWDCVPAIPRVCLLKRALPGVSARFTRSDVHIC